MPKNMVVALLRTLGSGGWTVAQAYSVLYAVVYVAYALVFLGLFAVVPAYVDWLSWGLTATVSVVLMARFHPFRATTALRQLAEGDDVLIFGSATIIFTNVVLAGATRIPVIANWLRSAETQKHKAQATVQDAVRDNVVGVASATTF